MVRRFLDIFGRFKTAPGRKRLLFGAVFRAGKALVPVAAAYRRTIIRSTRVIIVVGSFGKTTTTRVIYSSLGLSGRTPRGWNLGVYLAIELLRIRHGDHYGVLEVGIARKKMMVRCARLVKPDIVVVTSIGSEHYQSLGTLEETRHEKADMVRALPPSGIAVLNGDDPNVLWMRDATHARVITYGFGAACDIRASSVILDIRKGMRFNLHVNGTVLELSSCLIGRHQVYSLLAAVAVAVGEGLPLIDVLPRLQRVTPAPERLEIMPIENGAFLLVDTRKSVLETIISSFDTLAELHAVRKIVVLGEIEKPTPPQGRLYKDLIARLAHIATRIVFVGCRRAYEHLLSGARSAGMPRERIVFAGRSMSHVADLVRKDICSGDIVLIKGRGTQKLARVAFDLAGSPIPCDIKECKLKSKCSQCSLTKRLRKRSKKSIDSRER